MHLVPVENYPDDQNTLQEVVERACQGCPENFRQDAYWAAVAMTMLDIDPETALENQEIRTFVERVSRSGIADSYYRAIARPTTITDITACRASLPLWLQPEFQQQHAIRRLPSDTPPYDSTRIVTAYERFLIDNDLVLAAKNSWGDFYRRADETRPAVASPLWRKIYVEGASLQDALENGILQQVYSQLAAAGIEPYEMKLHDRDRLVFYFAPQTSLLIDEAEDVLRAAGLTYRGSAQDVWQIDEKGDGLLRVHSVESNDNAVGKSPLGWDAANPHLYQPGPFLGEYLRLCSDNGKSPKDPYKLSFVMIRLAANDPRLQDRDILQELALLAAPYPTVARPYPPTPPPRSRPIASRLKRD